MRTDPFLALPPEHRNARNWFGNANFKKGWAVQKNVPDLLALNDWAPDAQGNDSPSLMALRGLVAKAASVNPDSPQAAQWAAQALENGADNPDLWSKDYWRAKFITCLLRQENDYRILGQDNDADQLARLRRATLVRFPELLGWDHEKSSWSHPTAQALRLPKLGLGVAEEMLRHGGEPRGKLEEWVAMAVSRDDPRILGWLPEDVVDHALEHGLNGQPMLHACARRGAVAMLAHLGARLGDPNQRDVWGQTAAHAAIQGLIAVKRGMDDVWLPRTWDEMEPVIARQVAAIMALRDFGVDTEARVLPNPPKPKRSRRKADAHLPPPPKSPRRPGNACNPGETLFEALTRRSQPNPTRPDLHADTPHRVQSLLLQKSLGPLPPPDESDEPVFRPRRARL